MYMYIPCSEHAAAAPTRRDAKMTVGVLQLVAALATSSIPPIAVTRAPPPTAELYAFDAVGAIKGVPGPRRHPRWWNR